MGLRYNRSLPGKIIGIFARHFITGIFLLVESVVWNVLQRVGRPHQLCLTGDIFPNSGGGDTAGVRSSSDHKAEPEPDVAHQHDQPDQEDEEDGLVVGRGAGLLYLDQRGVVHHPAVDVLACLPAPDRRAGGGELLALPGSVDLRPLAVALQLLVEDVVARECVLRPTEVELGDQPQPDLHLAPSVPLRVGGGQVWRIISLYNNVNQDISKTKDIEIQELGGESCVSCGRSVNT